MLIRRRIERLERTSPPTIASLVDRIEREAMNAVSRDQGTNGDIPGSDVGDVEQSSGERYKADSRTLSSKSATKTWIA